MVKLFLVLAALGICAQSQADGVRPQKVLTACEKLAVAEAIKESAAYRTSHFISIEEGAESDRFGDPKTPNTYTVVLDDAEPYAFTAIVEVTIIPGENTCTIKKAVIVDLAS